MLLSEDLDLDLYKHIHQVVSMDFRAPPPSLIEYIPDDEESKVIAQEKINFNCLRLLIGQAKLSCNRIAVLMAIYMWRLPGSLEERKKAMGAFTLQFFLEKAEVDIERGYFHDILPKGISSMIPRQYILYGVDFLSTGRILNLFKDCQPELQWIDSSHCIISFASVELGQAAIKQNLQILQLGNNMEQDFVGEDWVEIYQYVEMDFLRRVYIRCARDSDLGRLHQDKGHKYMTYIQAKHQFELFLLAEPQIRSIYEKVLNQEEREKLLSIKKKSRKSRISSQGTSSKNRSEKMSRQQRLWQNFNPSQRHRSRERQRKSSEMMPQPQVILPYRWQQFSTPKPQLYPIFNQMQSHMQSQMQSHMQSQVNPQVNPYVNRQVNRQINSQVNPINNQSPASPLGNKSPILMQGLNAEPIPQRSEVVSQEERDELSFLFETVEDYLKEGKQGNPINGEMFNNYSSIQQTSNFILNLSSGRNPLINESSDITVNRQNASSLMRDSQDIEGESQEQESVRMSKKKGIKEEEEE